jgi:hypothetical protein
MLYLSYYCLFVLLNRTGEKHRIGSAWKQGLKGREGGGGGAGEEMTQTVYAHVNK